MVNYYLKMEPHLFREAVNNQYERIKEEREATAAAAKERQDSTPAASSDKSELVLYRYLMPVLRETLALCRWLAQAEAHLLIKLSPSLFLHFHTLMFDP